MRRQCWRISTLCLMGGFVFYPMTASSQVDTAWVRRYDLPPSGFDIATAMAIDGSGNVYVTGYAGRNGVGSEFATLKYDALGNLLWERRFIPAANTSNAPTAIAVDAAGYAVVTGFSDPIPPNPYETVTIRYEPDGDTLWLRRLIGVSAVDRDVGLDGLGNAYVAGYLYPGGAVLVKYDPDGNTVWSRSRTDGTYTAMHVGADGVVCAAGRAEYFSSYPDALVVKYEADGTKAWEALYDGPAQSLDYLVDVAVDGAGYVYAAGNSWGSTSTNPDWLTIKYEPDGDTAWIRRFDSGGGDLAHALGIDATGNVYVAGESQPVFGNTNFLLVKYDAAGNRLWERSYDPNGIGQADRAVDVAIDAAGAVYITGSSEPVGQPADWATLKYDSDGNLVWVRRYDGPAMADDYPAALLVDGSMNVYVTGNGTGETTGYDFVTIKYSPCDCDCPCHGDPMCDGKVDVLDVVATVSVAFRNGNAPTNGCCPYERSDVDCTGFTDVIDVTKVVGVAFRGADPAAEFCDPCA